jgi:alkyl sulfatase BDS1-like metallo-beta-lactamase superfamily hydrolase
VERFLSPAWFALLPPADGPPAEGARLVLEQRVTGTPEGEVTYQVSIADGRATIAQGSRAGADMTFTSDYGTATAIAAGRLSVETAMAAGRIRVSGNLARLQGAGPVLAGVDPLAAVRAETLFVEGEGGDGA